MSPNIGVMQNRCIAIQLVVFAWLSCGNVAHGVGQTACDGVLEQARSAIQQQQAQLAEATIRSALPRCAGDAEVYALLGMSLDEQGKYTAARDAFLRAITLSPNWASLHNNLATSYLHAGNNTAAEAEFRKALRIDSQNEIAMLNLAKISIDRKEFKPAIEILKTKDLDSIDDPAWIMALVEAYLGAGDREASARAAEVLVERSGGDASMEFSIGLLFARYGQPENALRYLERIPDAQRDSATYQDIGLSYEAVGKTDEAEGAFQAALKADSSDPHAYLDLAGLYLTSHRAEQALLTLRQGHEKSPKSADITFALAETMIHMNSLSEADSLLAGEVKEQPKSVLLQQARGDLFNRQHRDEESALAYRESLRLDPKWVDSRIGLAWLYQRSGKSAEAKAEYANVLRLAPGCAAGNAGLGTIALDAGQIDQAIQYLDKALKEAPDNIDAGLSLATAYMRNSAYESADQTAQKLSKIDPGNSQIHYLAGRALMKLNRKEEAQQEFDTAQKLVAAKGTKPEERVATAPEGCSSSIGAVVQTTAHSGSN